jgi:4-hydroxy-L-threonine phosphate dehydrogenase PdxA
MKVLVLTLGDRYGVGAELVARFTSALPPDLGVHVVVVGDRLVFDRGRKTYGLGTDYPTAASIETLPETAWSFVDWPFEAAVEPVGRVSPDAGREVLGTLGRLVEAARAGLVHGIVYAPLNKQAMREAGHEAGDELDYFARALPGPGATGEINILGDVWTSRVTSHVPLKEVAKGITFETVTRGITLMDETLRRAGKSAPRIAVAALNPHAGEGGAFGMEEIEVIAPAVKAAQKRQLRVEGPFPSDTVFPRAIGGAFDGVVTMFHDQGQIALKLIGLGQGITLLAGFPVPIATPGHGTAFDIAGTGKAKVDGLAAAVSLVAKMMRG